jgi:hypothetical protein
VSNLSSFISGQTLVVDGGLCWVPAGREGGQAGG